MASGPSAVAGGRAERLRRAVALLRAWLGPEADRALADPVVADDLREIARVRSAAEIERAFAEARRAGARRFAWVARRLLGAPPGDRRRGHSHG